MCQPMRKKIITSIKNFFKKKKGKMAVSKGSYPGNAPNSSRDFIYNSPLLPPAFPSFINGRPIPVVLYIYYPVLLLSPYSQFGDSGYDCCRRPSIWEPPLLCCSSRRSRFPPTSILSLPSTEVTNYRVAITKHAFLVYILL